MFFKMQGLGNDYIYLDCTKGRQPKEIKKLAIELSNRHFGVGSDGLILICDSQIADLKMRMFNSDGSEAQMCGNGIRCVAKLVYELGLVKKEKIAIETLAGIKKLKLNLVHGKVKNVEVDMGEPILELEKIPVIINDNKKEIFNDKTKEISLYVKNKKMSFICVSMGNPHAVTFVKNIKEFPVEKYGSIIEKNEIFPEKTNVEFVEIINKENIKMRVWERGAGETLACGTGACASVVASTLKKYTNNKVDVELLGGNLKIEWNENNHIYMTGPAVTVFKGEWINDLY